MARIYFGLATLSAITVYFANDAINGFLGRSSTLGAIVLFAILPLAAILTRPLVVAAQRGHTQRAIGIVYALRSFRFGFFVKSVAIWLVLTTTVITTIGFLYHEAEMPTAAGVANWWYLTTLFVLLVHLVPGQFRLPPAKPVTFVVCGPRSAGKSTFIGLLPLEEMPHDWTVMPSENARNLLLHLHARAKGKTELDPAAGNTRLTFMRPRLWSGYVGTRPTPVDFVEHDDPKRTGIVLLIPANGSIVAELQRQLHALHKTDKIAQPVAVVLTKIDLAPDAQLSPDAIELLNENCRKWKAFTASDRGGETSDVEGFSPKGFMAAALWLLEHV